MPQQAPVRYAFREEESVGKLDGKVAIVTGASRGIGAEVARLFVAEGAKVVCSARTVREGDHRLEGSLEQTLQGIRESGGDVTIAAANLAFPEECEKLVKATHDAYGPVDVLVNNAAETNPFSTAVKDYPLEDWMRSWAVNVHANFILSKFAIKDMISLGGGSIVNIGSGSAIGPGRGPYPEDSVAYGTVKATLERLTQGLAMEVYRYGVSVTCLSPSQVVPTPSVIEDGLLTGLDDPRGEPLDMMVKATLLLATEPLDKVTGRVCYSQQILKEFGWIDEARGTGSSGGGRGSGYSEI